MHKIIIILNHIPTQKQIQELKSKFKISEILYLDKKIQEKLKNIPPSEEISQDFLNELISFIKNNISIGDYIWIQTEYGITFFIVDFAIKNGFIPIYSTTQRIYKEKKLEKDKVERNYIFEHVTFRKYKPYEE